MFRVITLRQLQLPWKAISVALLLLMLLQASFLVYRLPSTVPKPTTYNLNPTTTVPQSIEDYISHDHLKIQTASDGSYRAWSTTKATFSKNQVSFSSLMGESERGWQASFVVDSVNGTPVTRGTPRANDVTVSYPLVLEKRTENREQSWPIVEMYENRADGIEQKFVIADNLNPTTYNLQLTGHFETDLIPERVPGQGIIFKDANGVPQLQYGEATVIDATGKTAPVSMSLRGGETDEAISSNEIATTYGLAMTIDAANLTFPIIIDPIITTPATFFDPTDQLTALFGIWVATAGDVNGDGYSDVAAGAASWDGEAEGEGRVYVYHGSASGILPASPALILDPTDLFGAAFGANIASAGDVNGDGYDDLLIRAEGYDGPGPDGIPGNGDDWNNEGRTYVYHGSSSGLGSSPATTLDPTNQALAVFGYAESTAGDVNGDGYSDVVISALGWNGEAIDEGRVYVYHGSPAGLSDPPATILDPTDQAGAAFGISVATAGDVNGDGYSDIVVGAYTWNGAAADEGRAYVYHGSETGISTIPALILDPTDQASAWFGFRVSTAGDANGDGYSDVVIGAYSFDTPQALNEGRIYVYYGSAAGLPSVASFTSDPTDQLSSGFTNSLFTAGDVNGDGYSDIVIAAELYDTPEWTNEGRMYVYYGSANGYSDSAISTADPTDQTTARFGQAISTAGDVNGDGYSDIIVGAHRFNADVIDEGRVYIFHGGPDGLAEDVGWTADPTDQENSRISSVSSAGDVNGDGFSDIIIGAEGFTDEFTEEGAAFLFLGSSDGFAASPDWTVDPTDKNYANFGNSVATAGDVNGDGYSDVIVGAPWYDAEDHDGEGRAYIYHGGPSGLSTEPAVILEPDTDDNFVGFGFDVNTAGDINGDGYSDILVSFDQLNRVNIYLGSMSGIDMTPSLILDEPTDQDNSSFGNSVATAGDINGDGFDDVIISAPTFLDPGPDGILFEGDDDLLNAGRVYVYLGSASGLGTDPAEVIDSGQAGAFFGSSNNPNISLGDRSGVASAGDVNGDGFNDIVIGAYSYSNEAQYEGRAFVYLGSAGGLSAIPDWTVDPTDETGAHFGSVSSAGDINGDGYSDVIVGADRFNNEADEGMAYLYLGSIDGLSVIPDWTADPTDQENAEFGGFVAAAHDVNGDGFDDVIVGARQADADFSFEGRAYLYYGGGGRGLTLQPQQFRTDGTTPIAHPTGASDDNESFVTSLLARTPAGRGTVRAEIETKPLGTAFDGTDTVITDDVDTGDPAEDPISITTLIDNLEPNGTPYHWRVRYLYNQSPLTYLGGEVSRWLSLDGSSSGMDFRTANAAPDAPATFDQRSTDSDETIAVGEEAETRDVTLAVTTTDDGPTYTLEIEVKPVGTAFNGEDTLTSAMTDSGDEATIATTLDPDDYHWRARSIDSNLSTSDWVSFGGNSEDATDFTSPNILPVITDLSQTRTDNNNIVNTGSHTNTRSLTFAATGTDEDGPIYTLEIEIKDNSIDFNGADTLLSEVTDSGVEASISTNLDAGTYHWRARVIDDFDGTSNWTSFGGNADGRTDFRIITGSSTYTPPPVTEEPATLPSLAPAEPAVCGNRVCETNETFDNCQYDCPATVTPPLIPSTNPAKLSISKIVFINSSVEASWSRTGIVTAILGFSALILLGAGLTLRRRGHLHSGGSSNTIMLLAITLGASSLIVFGGRTSVQSEVRPRYISFAQALSNQDNQSVSPGDQLTYELQVSNSGGPTTGTNEIWDPIPQYTTYVSGTLSLNGITQTEAFDADYAEKTNGALRFRIPQVPSGATATVRFTVIVNADAQDSIRNTAILSGPDLPTSLRSNTTQNPLAVVEEEGEQIEPPSPQPSPIEGEGTVSSPLTGEEQGEGEQVTPPSTPAPEPLGGDSSGSITSPEVSPPTSSEETPPEVIPPSPTPPIEGGEDITASPPPEITPPTTPPTTKQPTTFIQKTVQTAKEHPVATASTGVGLGYLLFLILKWLITLLTGRHQD